MRLTIVIVAVIFLATGITPPASPAIKSADNAAVFAEVASASYCPDCPAMNEMLFDLYTSHEYNFYYVTMVGDKNEFAYDRIKNDYNFYWYPTIFLDGGYRVFLDASRDALEKAIEESMAKERPNIDMEVEATWVKCSCQVDGLYIETHIRNLENTAYKGVLRVYVAEINSRWDDYSGNQYHFAFLAFADVNALSLDPHKEKTFSSTWIPESYNYNDIGGEDANNLAVFAVLFNTTAHTQYANPPDKNPFNAYYVDAMAAYIPRNVPPSVSITSPKQGYLYIFDREIIRINRTIIIGSKMVEVKTFDESGIDRVEVYVDGVLKTTLHEPYQWKWKDFGEHKLEVVAYDVYGLNATDSLDALILA